MKNKSERILGPCVLCGRYFYGRSITRPPKYCWECREFAKRENNRNRQRSYRQRRKEADKTAANSREPEAARPVAGCGREDVRATSPRGLFADLPEPTRSNRRQEVGLR